MHRELKKLEGRPGAVVHDVEHKTAAWDAIPATLTPELVPSSHLGTDQIQQAVQPARARGGANPCDQIVHRS